MHIYMYHNYHSMYKLKLKSKQLSSLYVLTAYKPCLGDQMTCDNYKCVNQTSVCDGKDDCGDASDEKGCGEYLMKFCGETEI